jgi:hypothetical protein
MSNNIHLLLLGDFYVKRTAVDVALCAKAKLKASKKTMTVAVDAQQIEYDWRYQGHTTVFDVSLGRKDELTGEDVSRLDNVSFLHSILYLVDSTQHYAAGLTAHKRADCVELLELVRRHLSAGKMGKEAARITQNLTDHVYTGATMQSIVDYFHCFHLIVLSNNVAEAPKLYAAGPTYQAAGAVVMVYFDEQKELYYPISCVQWHEENFMRFLKGVYLWNKPIDTKKWAVADMRAYILFFGMPIDTTMDKKALLAQFVI